MLSIKNLSKTFHPGTVNEVKVLQDICCLVEEGSFVVLVGSNGSGKSSLLNAIAGVFYCDSGQILLDGRNIARLPEHRRAAWIGRVFQNPFTGTAPGMSIAENLSLASKRGGRRGLGPALSAAALADFREKLRPLNMGLEDRLHSPIGKLSGGQRQALTLLMASLRKPRLLLLDEHTAALDPTTAARVVHLTGEIVRNGGITAMMVTHSMQQAARMGDRLLMLHRGKIIHDFSGQEKQQLKAADMAGLFEEVRKKELIDPAAARLLQSRYV
ncbi:MAG TPA: ATP-binding cassette domain-containing protein [Bacteroidales bacterium]|nr:ATP-binding cassette domain-containing protein [Bacteroidales bacterium]HSA42274.1 ATP-binding cassette domain-containing protein [Bacteroidales bacterium]